MKHIEKRRFLWACMVCLGFFALFLFAAPLSPIRADSTLTITSTKTTVKAGKTLQLTASESGVTWSVSNQKKATIDANGLLTANRYGKVKVTATLGTESATVTITIQPKKVIGIDPGHQKYANTSKEAIGPGASTKKTCVAGGTRGVSTGTPEYKLTLQIAKKLKKELVSRGYKVVMTRTKNNVNITNKERALLLNASCDIAIRLHADGASSSSVKGASALYPSKNNPYVSSLSKKSKKLSRCILNAYCAETGIKNRGLSKRDDLTGTNWSTIPVTLIELGFMTNSSDDNYMSSSSGQNEMVTGIADGIDDYFGY